MSKITSLCEAVLKSADNANNYNCSDKEFVRGLDHVQESIPVPLLVIVVAMLARLLLFTLESGRPILIGLVSRLVIHQPQFKAALETQISRLVHVHMARHVFQ